MINLILFLIILSVIVMVHEFGHFLFAKLSGTYVYEFSLGMGKKLFSYKPKNSETEYCIRLVPIGGFVSLAGEEVDNDDSIPQDRKMYAKTFWQRFLIMFAGPGFNFILTFIILLISALIFGSVSSKPIIGEVSPEYPAYEAGLKSGDLILSVNNKKVKTWDSALLEIQLNAGKTMKFKVQGEDGETRTISITPKKVVGDDDTVTYVYGISRQNEIEKGLGASFNYAVTKTGSLFNLMLETVKSLFTGKVGVNDLSGPVGIYTIVGEQAKAGINSLLYLTAYLSINIGVINLIPFPAFDGGRILFLIIEKLTGKTIPPKVENIIHGIGFVLLMILMFYITCHDIISLF